MTGIVCDSLLKAQTFSDAIDGKLGYPRNGIEVGGGIHVPISLGRAVRYADLVAHPTLPLWAYPQDATVAAQGLALPISATVQTLDATWFPAPIVTGV